MSSLPRNLGGDRDFLTSPVPPMASQDSWKGMGRKTSPNLDEENSELTLAHEYSAGHGEDSLKSRMDVLLSPFRENAGVVNNNSRSSSPSKFERDRLYMTGDAEDMKKMLAAVREMHQRRASAKLIADQEVLKVLSSVQKETDARVTMSVPAATKRRRGSLTSINDEARENVKRIAGRFLQEDPDDPDATRLMKLMDDLLELRTKTKVATRILFAISPFMRQLDAINDTRESNWASFKLVAGENADGTMERDASEIPKLVRSKSLRVSTVPSKPSLHVDVAVTRGRGRVRGERAESSGRDRESASANAMAIERSLEDFEKRWQEWQHDLLEPPSPAFTRSPGTPMFGYFCPPTPESATLFPRARGFSDASPDRQLSDEGEHPPKTLRQVSDGSSMRCRICESMVPTAQIEGHFKTCLLEYREYYCEYRLLRLSDTLRRLRVQAIAEERADMVLKNAMRTGGGAGSVTEDSSPCAGESEQKPMSAIAILAVLIESVAAIRAIEARPGTSDSVRTDDSNMLPDEWYQPKQRIRESLGELKALKDEQGKGGLLQAAEAAAREAIELHRTKISLVKPKTHAEYLRNELSAPNSRSSTPEGARGGATVTFEANVANTHKKRNSKRRLRSRRSVSEPGIHDFEILKPVSRGAYGRVYLASKRRTGDVFAIKVLEKKEIVRKNQVERIMAERNVLVAADCPFVVKLYYSFQSKRRLYLVMEFVHGGDLLTLLQNCGCLDEEYCRQYISEIVVALKYLHRHGIIHRDIKPDNVLVDKNGHIKLTDFGLSSIGVVDATNENAYATIESPRLLSPNLTLEIEGNGDDEMREMLLKSKVGTPDYMAPEILLGTGHDFTCDWWSVGVITFELLTGYPPFNDETPDAIFENILSATVEYQSDEMSPQAQSFISALLVLNPRNRLGAKGASQVQKHAFFGNAIEWAKLERGEFAGEEPPFIPVLESEIDTSYFDESRQANRRASEVDDARHLKRHFSSGGISDFHEETSPASASAGSKSHDFGAEGDAPRPSSSPVAISSSRRSNKSRSSKGGTSVDEMNRIFDELNFTYSNLDSLAKKMTSEMNKRSPALGAKGPGDGK